MAVDLEQQDPPDLELVRRARAGDEEAFERIVRRHGARVFRVASRYFRQRDRVEEISQDVFLRAYTQLGTFEGRGSFEGWLTHLATNVCLNALRTAKRRPEHFVASAATTDDEAEWLDRKLAGASMARHESAERSIVAADLAEKVLGTLSPDDRVALTLSDAEDLSVREIVEATGWSESKVKTQTFRARRRMREAVEKLLGRDKRAGP